MTDKSETSGKGPGPDPEAGSGKRPHATLDLKATEVKNATAGKPGPAGEGPREGDARSAPAAGVKASAIPGPGKPGDPAGSQTAAKSQAATTAASASSRPAAGTRGGSLGRLAASLAAGFAGGLIVLFGGEKLAANLGLPGQGAGSAERAGEIDRRLAALEETMRSQGDKSVAMPEAAAERLQRLEESEKRLAGLESRQAELAEAAKALAARLDAQPPSADAAERVARLEQRLATLAAAAETDSDKGRIPGLAAVTGKLSDLEAAVANQFAALRKAVPQEVEARVAPVAETSEAAKSGAQRLDRDVAALKTEAARLTQRLESLKAEADRASAVIKSIEEQQGTFTGNVEAVVKQAAKPADIATAVTPLAAKVAFLEKNLDAVVKSEDERKTAAERVVVALELANLKRALEQGRPYEAELQAVKSASGGRIGLAALDRYKSSGVPALSRLAEEFKSIANAIVDAEAEPPTGSVMDRLVAGARSVVRVRKVDHAPGDSSAEAIVARIEAALAGGRIAEAVSETGKLSDRARAPANAWLSKVEGRMAVDAAIAAVETELKSSISGTPAPQGAVSPPPAPPAQN